MPSPEETHGAHSTLSSVERHRLNTLLAENQNVTGAQLTDLIANFLEDGNEQGLLKLLTQCPLILQLIRILPLLFLACSLLNIRLGHSPL